VGTNGLVFELEASPALKSVILDEFVAATGSATSAHLVGEREWQMFFEIPLLFCFLLFLERIAHGDGIFRAMIEADHSMKMAVLLSLFLDANDGRRVHVPHSLPLFINIHHVGFFAVGLCNVFDVGMFRFRIAALVKDIQNDLGDDIACCTRANADEDRGDQRGIELRTSGSDDTRLARIVLGSQLV